MSAQLNKSAAFAFDFNVDNHSRPNDGNQDGPGISHPVKPESRNETHVSLQVKWPKLEC